MRPPLLWGLALALGALVLAWAHVTLSASAARVHAAKALVATTEVQLTDLARLRAASPTFEAAERPAQDLIARVHATLASAGLPGNLLQEVTPQGDVAAAPQSDLRRQSVLVRLRPSSPLDIGRFLVAWEREQPAWIPTAAEWTHRAAGDTTNLYELALTVTATYRAP